MFKINLGSDCFLKLRSMREESLVIADKYAAVKGYLAFVHTARHVMEVGCI
jgi:hypothetical protein